MTWRSACRGISRPLRSPRARTRADPHAQEARSRGAMGARDAARVRSCAHRRRPIADRVIAGWHGRRMREEFPPWRGQGRLLDVGCASGRFIRQMSEIGWRVAGIELDREAAAKARRVSTDVFVGDPVDADFAPGAFDVITSFHVIEHLARPLETLRRMLTWLAPGGHHRRGAQRGRRGRAALRAVLVGPRFSAPPHSLHPARRRARDRGASSDQTSLPDSQPAPSPHRPVGPDRDGGARGGGEPARARRAQARARGVAAVGSAAPPRGGGPVLHRSGLTRTRSAIARARHGIMRGR